ncbi:23S rRNA (cytidine1920-2'-O)/16S rRNA (cytidine1409-2'-O)-methyltransferase [Psychromicrobium silvestre]|uniref:23S rRNA (Cytidine1920-2'-O)/16S rRNA (Cytidine1409-2'-O)-methyltransferase n=1 Tax=Psychromicrobium silvestre TaxID=1645614 RepID=A0A7Y9LQP9_9MICC|nr:TlyA family RNA methyltransferase [Psychromicrobium silvestre]NYE93837.1 23S rRNA (cytidine1920-2'-O)/16S rRNA (cytidine1409-2'-O)-methyltransferase [Psychromicrobium silvestre]
MPRLDQELLALGLARSRTQAAKLIAEGAVLIGGQPALKPSQLVSGDEQITVRTSESNRYVSRAAYKLLGALGSFPAISVLGERCLDAGASTGGFSQVLLEAGAREVVAVDVGHGQLVPELREDPRVQVHEGLNVRQLSAEQIGGQAGLTVADLSFISLTLVIEPLAQATAPGGQLLLMVKPQFEVGRERLSKTGVVGSEQERRRAVQTVAEAARSAGLQLRGLASSSLPGQDGNVEYFLWLTKGESEGQSKLGVQEFLEEHWPAGEPGEQAKKQIGKQASRKVVG